MSEKVTITIDCSNSHLGVRFYADTKNLDDDKAVFVKAGESNAFTVTKDSVARIRIYIQANGYYVPDDYKIDGTTNINDSDGSIYNGWCRAAFTITADETKTIVIPEGTECAHPNKSDDVYWGYYNLKNGTHVKKCTQCSMNFEGTTASHEIAEMTVTEYVNSYYGTDDSTKDAREWFINYIMEDLGVTADTKIQVCTKFCEYYAKIPTTTTVESSSEASSEASSSEASSEASSQTSAVSTVSASLTDESGVLPEGTTISSASVTTGEVYEKATSIIKEKISGLGQFAVMDTEKR